MFLWPFSVDTEVPVFFKHVMQQLLKSLSHPEASLFKTVVSIKYAPLYFFPNLLFHLRNNEEDTNCIIANLYPTQLYITLIFRQ